LNFLPGQETFLVSYSLDEVRSLLSEPLYKRVSKGFPRD